MNDQQQRSPEEAGKGTQQLKRGLSNRHLQMIAIGGAIGTGLFLGSGKTISLAGPSILLVYGIIGFFLFFVMRAMGEMLLANLRYKSFRDIAEDQLGEWAGFFSGWTYWFCWIVIGIADILAISAYLAYWWPDLPKWIGGVGLIVLMLGLNLMTVKLFGEIEFWFAIIKIVAIISLIVIAAILVAVSFTSPSGHTASLSNLVNDGGFFATGFMGFIAGFQLAIFAFLGIELVGTAAAETENPEKTLPRAINAIPVRVALFYILALVAIMAVTPWREINPEVSPFVSMLSLTGFGAAASIVNFVVLSSAASSANSGIYSTSRMLYGLARVRKAPPVFAKLSIRGVPAAGLLFSCTCLLPGLVLLYTSDTIIEAFTLVTTVASVLFMFVWCLIICSYLVYRSKQPELHKKSVFKMPLGRIMCVAVLVFFAIVLVILALEPDTRTGIILTPIWFIILGIAYRVHRGKVTEQV
ncbi:D-serine/D-alanine/glycine transporter [Corynebacterium pacaense]|uniref:D-serine/D-alanine/glycine transporter n=1 Tax=Corynebacterium pacaense TaxID=1816684 RepID=UPI0009BB206B|nr:D-serine/D-alanine/glycine transporter [Corynebacterium pacaense]